MESVPFQARFFFSLYSVNTYGPFSVDKKRIGWIRIFSYLLSEQCSPFRLGIPPAETSSGFVTSKNVKLAFTGIGGLICTQGKKLDDYMSWQLLKQL